MNTLFKSRLIEKVTGKVSMPFCLLITKISRKKTSRVSFLEKNRNVQLTEKANVCPLYDCFKRLKNTPTSQLLSKGHKNTKVSNTTTIVLCVNYAWIIVRVSGLYTMYQKKTNTTNRYYIMRILLIKAHHNAKS